MIPKRLNLTFLGLALGALSLFAQEKSPIKFGKVTPADFVLPAGIADSSADAVVIADIGNSEFEGNAKGWFSIIFRRTKRVKILNKNGFEAANVSIDLYSNGSDVERLAKLKAVTYNLEGGKVIETRWDDNNLFKNVLSKNRVEKKFTFPAVKEGSIIEYTYTISSDFLTQLQPWTFQGEYPCLWSEYEVALPFFFDYVFLTQGYNPFHINNRTTSFQNWSVTDPGFAGPRGNTYNFSGNVVYSRWVMKDVMPIKEENYTSTLRNHVSKIEFQLSQYRFPNMPVKDQMSNWTKINEQMMQYEEFGATLDKNNNWMKDELNSVVAISDDNLVKVRKIYSYLRDNFTCTNHYALYLSSTLKNIMKVKNGSVADLNLLLCALLKHENIDANPVILGTRDRGQTHPFYPLLERFNYVICEVKMGNRTYYLDASRPGLGFGKLPSSCYNGHARVLGKVCRPVFFLPDSLVERSVTTVFLINDGKSGLLGNYQSVGGFFESLQIRQKFKDKGETAFLKEIASSFGSDMEIKNPGVDSIKNFEEPVSLHYDFRMNTEEDIIYFNPIIRQGYRENPFKAADRKYPVEKPSTIDEVYVLNMEIPAGYEVEEIPKSVKMSFNDTEGYFEYLVQKEVGHVQLRSRVVLRKASFSNEEYGSLRQFFGEIVKKHSEQVVFRKKKA
ncbi:MAG: DUF3857 domain-containing protein [Chitinophagaceae bacterium]|nr:DUF3857 domain-containing protein [Chitinophagaceae bacterium]